MAAFSKREKEKQPTTESASVVTLNARKEVDRKPAENDTREFGFL